MGSDLEFSRFRWSKWRQKRFVRRPVTCKKLKKGFDYPDTAVWGIFTFDTASAVRGILAFTARGACASAVPENADRAQRIQLHVGFETWHREIAVAFVDRFFQPGERLLLFAQTGIDSGDVIS